MRISIFGFQLEIKLRRVQPVVLTSGVYDMFGYHDETVDVDTSDEVVGYWHNGEYMCDDCVAQEFGGRMDEFWADNPEPVTAIQALFAGYPVCSVHGDQYAIVELTRTQANRLKPCEWPTRANGLLTVYGQGRVGRWLARSIC